MKIAVAMSGGIDSSVTAVILKNAGHDVMGITARFLPHDRRYDPIFSAAAEDAENAALHFGIEHIQYDFSAEFERTVISDFRNEYMNGRTPNPCIRCNHNIKFRLLLDAAFNNGCDMLATGHYALKMESGGRYYISAAEDRNRDQSYFLCMLEQEQIRNIILPLGRYSKDRIRAMAFDAGLTIHDKPDSQEICFIPGNDYASFLESDPCFSPQQGEIRDSSGKILGRHGGIHRYTIGQRRGMGVSSSMPLYVISINPSENMIIAGPREELMTAGLITTGCHDMKEIITDRIHASVKTRSTQRHIPCEVWRSDGSFIARFDEPMAGVSPGQSAVFYDEDGGILGCGIIEKGISSF